MMKRFNKKLRMGYQQLAAELGCSHAHLIGLENGTHRPSAEFILKLAHYFNVTTDQLLEDNQDID